MILAAAVSHGHHLSMGTSQVVADIILGVIVLAVILVIKRAAGFLSRRSPGPSQRRSRRDRRQPSRHPY